MANLDKIRIIKGGVITDYELAGGVPSEIELPVDYNTVYDTEERQVGWYAVTGGYKPLYRKMYLYSNLVANTATNIADTPENYDFIQIVEGVFINDAGNYFISTVSTSNGYYAWIRTRENATSPNKITVQAGAVCPEVRITIKYTKTTDEVVEEIPAQTIPGVIQKYIDTVPVGTEFDYDGETVPSGWEKVDDPNAYSTEEQRIGTWIDGKPLYRKVINNISISSANTVTINFPINIETIILKYAVVEISGNLVVLPRTFADNTTIRIIDLRASAMIIDNSSSYSGTGLFIIEYTKTTDEGGNV